MLLNHLAAIFFFSGPLLYAGLLIALYPTEIATVPQCVFDAARRFVLNDGTVPAEQKGISLPIRRALRIAGVALVLIAIGI